MAKGAAWMVLMRLASRTIGLISTIILARLLVPADFGLVAIATTIAFAIDTLGEFSFDFALIRDQAASRAHYDAAWTLGLVRGLVVAVALAAGAIPASLFFADARLEPILYVLAGTALAQAAQNIGVVDFRKEMNFDREFAFMLWPRLAGFVVTIALAFAWRDWRALVAGIVATRLAQLVLSYTMHPYRPRLGLAEWRPIMSFSKWMLVNNILYFLSGRADTIILGRMFGPHLLGLYSVASEISALPTTELVWPIQRALFPGFARLADDPAALRRSYLDGFGVLLAIALPASVGIALIAEPAIRLFLGPKWLDAIPLLQVLAICGMFRLGGANAGSAMLALGRARAFTLLVTVNVAIQLPLLIGGAYAGGVTGAAIGLTISAGIGLMLVMIATDRLLGVSPRELIAAVWRTLAAAAIMAGNVVALQNAWHAWGLPESNALELGAAVVSGALVYVAAHLLLWRVAGMPAGAERILLNALIELKGKYFGGKEPPHPSTSSG